MSVVDRNAYTARLERAKKVCDSLLRFTNSPAALVLSAEHRATLGDLSMLLVELAQLSHAKFDFDPYDFPALVRRLESLERKSDGED